MKLQTQFMFHTGLDWMILNLYVFVDMYILCAYTISNPNVLLRLKFLTLSNITHH